MATGNGLALAAPEPAPIFTRGWQRSVVPGVTAPGATGNENRNWLKPARRSGLCLTRFPGPGMPGLS